MTYRMSNTTHPHPGKHTLQGAGSISWHGDDKCYVLSWYKDNDVPVGPQLRTGHEDMGSVQKTNQCCSIGRRLIYLTLRDGTSIARLSPGEEDVNNLIINMMELLWSLACRLFSLRCVMMHARMLMMHACMPTSKFTRTRSFVLF